MTTASTRPPIGLARLTAERRLLLVRIVAAVAVVLLAMKIVLPQQVEVGFLAAAALTPLWLPALRRFYGARLLVGVGVLAIFAGLWLARANAGDHAIDAAIATSTTILLIGAVLSIGLLLWARTLFSVPTVALLFGIGLLLGLSPSTALFSGNPWKFGFALPLGVIGLALAKLSKRWWVELLVVVALILASATTDARSTFALLLLALLLLIAQLPLFRAGHRGSAVLVSLGLVVAAIAIYLIGQALILGGLLGQATAARSLAQVDRSGSLVLGGRPELGATVALIRAFPGGFGAGVVPNPSEVAVAQTGMKAIGYDPNNGYVSRYMFGGHVELHSGVGDLWAQTGIAGLILVAVAVVLLLAGVTRHIADGTAGAIVLYLVAKALWDLAFSPFFNGEATFVLALALVAVPVAARAPIPKIGARRAGLREEPVAAAAPTPAAAPVPAAAAAAVPTAVAAAAAEPAAAATTR